jgi:hypothetical protein
MATEVYMRGECAIAGRFGRGYGDGDGDGNGSGYGDCKGDRKTSKNMK